MTKANASPQQTGVSREVIVVVEAHARTVERLLLGPPQGHSQEQGAA